ncbi:MAG TPA: hypothetical protein VFW45_16180 [Candidatus Polarisedimenticolia bacterium]|nr:hypothetical protein [Candidatus Polarisedimenticolia bacterium]
MRFTRRHACWGLLLGLLIPSSLSASGYTFYRIIIWGEPGEQPARLQQNAGGEFSLLFLPPAPESGWDPVLARRLAVTANAVVDADPVPILRPRDPDPDWDTSALEGSFDLNRDGRAEILKARTVMVPDSRDPGASQQRVIVELSEEGRILFVDRLEGISGAGVRAHGASATDFTEDGYPDLIIRLEAEDRTGVALYSQKPLRYAGSATRRIDGSSADFRADGYGIFNLGRSPKEFFAKLPSAARPDRPGCPATQGVDADKLAHCGYSFVSPYLGWIQAFQVDYLPSNSLKAFRFYFPGAAASISPEEALSFLVPVFGGDFRESSKNGAAGGKNLSWQWKGKGSSATLEAEQDRSGKKRCLRLTLQKL